MATDPDPYRTLGLSRAASTDEIRRAYRRLAKANHPDSAGEAALPRFLAIQAAYELLVGPSRRGSAGRDAAREPWRADPDRARATRGGQRRGSAAGDPGGDPATDRGAAGRGPSSRGRPRPGGRPDSMRGSPSGPGSASGAASASRGPRPTDEGRRSARRARPSNRATPGSTTYDAAEDEPFEPEWSGGTWYGASSGTYWTINPKEYADPRKHGPEYQARARRHPDDTDPDMAGGAAASGDPAMSDGAAAAEAEEPIAFTVDPSAGPAPGFGESAGSTARDVGGVSAGVPPDSGEPPFLRLRSGFGGRVVLALVGWPPIGIAISTFAGEATGCSRFAASCVDLFGVGTWLAQLAVIAILLAVPALAELSAVGTIAALAAAVPTAVALSATGGSREPVASAAALGFVLAIAYLVGVAVATVRRLGFRRLPLR